MRGQVRPGRQRLPKLAPRAGPRGGERRGPEATEGARVPRPSSMPNERGDGGVRPDAGASVGCSPIRRKTLQVDLAGDDGRIRTHEQEVRPQEPGPRTPDRASREAVTRE